MKTRSVHISEEIFLKLKTLSAIKDIKMGVLIDSMLEHALLEYKDVINSVHSLLDKTEHRKNSFKEILNDEHEKKYNVIDMCDLEK